MHILKSIYFGLKRLYIYHNIIFNTSENGYVFFDFYPHTTQQL